MSALSETAVAASPFVNGKQDLVDCEACTFLVELQAKQIDRSSDTSSHHQSSLVRPCVVALIITALDRSDFQVAVSVPFRLGSVLVLPRTLPVSADRSQDGVLLFRTPHSDNRSSRRGAALNSSL